MITNQRAYAELCERERWEELARMSIEESITRTFHVEDWMCALAQLRKQ